MIEQYALEAWEYIQFFRLEIAIGVGLLLLEVIRRKHSTNVKVTRWIDYLQEQALQHLEAATKKPLSTTASKKQKLRRKLRRQAVREARKIQRGRGKGSKTSDGPS
jgi:hypothetical protein